MSICQAVSQDFNIDNNFTSQLKQLLLMCQKIKGRNNRISTKLLCMTQSKKIYTLCKNAFDYLATP